MQYPSETFLIVPQKLEEKDRLEAVQARWTKTRLLLGGRESLPTLWADLFNKTVWEISVSEISRQFCLGAGKKSKKYLLGSLFRPPVAKVLSKVSMEKFNPPNKFAFA